MGGPIAGFVLKVCPAKPAILYSLILNNACMLLFSLTPTGSASLLVVFRGLVGFTQVVICIYSPLWTDYHSPAKSRAMWLSYLQASVPIGVMGGYVLATAALWVRDSQSLTCPVFACWRWPFLLQVLLLTPLIVCLFFVPDKDIDIYMNHQQQCHAAIVNARVAQNGNYDDEKGSAVGGGVRRDDHYNDDDDDEERNIRHALHRTTSPQDSQYDEISRFNADESCNSHAASCSKNYGALNISCSSHQTVGPSVPGEASSLLMGQDDAAVVVNPNKGVGEAGGMNRMIKSQNEASTLFSPYKTSRMLRDNYNSFSDLTKLKDDDGGAFFASPSSEAEADDASVAESSATGGASTHVEGDVILDNTSDSADTVSCNSTGNTDTEAGCSKVSTPKKKNLASLTPYMLAPPPPSSPFPLLQSDTDGGELDRHLFGSSKPNPAKQVRKKGKEIATTRMRTSSGFKHLDIYKKQLSDLTLSPRFLCVNFSRVDAGLHFNTGSHSSVCLPYAGPFSSVLCGHRRAILGNSLPGVVLGRYPVRG